MVAEVRTTLHYHEKSKSNNKQRAAAKTLTTARRALSVFNDTDSLFQNQIIEINSTSIPDSMQAGGEGVEHDVSERGVASPPSFMGPAGRNGLGSQVVAKDVMQITGGSPLEGARQPTQLGLGASGVGQTPESRAMTTLLQSGEEQVQDSGPRQSEASYEEPEEGSYTPLFRSRYGHGPDTSPETLESVSSGQAAAASHDDGNVEGLSLIHI